MLLIAQLACCSLRNAPPVMIPPPRVTDLCNTANPLLPIDGGCLNCAVSNQKMPGAVVARHDRDQIAAQVWTTFARLAECQYVMEVLGDLPLRVAYEQLAGMVRMLGEDVQAMALRNAYAIDMPAPDTLTRRRERIAGIHGLSIDTVELYERNMIDGLALRLMHGELPVGS